MLRDLNAPRELIILMRLVAIIGATKVGVVVYTEFIDPSPPTAAEIAASEQEIERLAQAGEQRVLADFRRRSVGVEEAAQGCVEGRKASCRWAEIWLERYADRAREILAADHEHDPETIQAARRYRGAAAVIDEDRRAARR